MNRNKRALYWTMSLMMLGLIGLMQMTATQADSGNSPALTNAEVQTMFSGSLLKWDATTNYIELEYTTNNTTQMKDFNSDTNNFLQGRTNLWTDGTFNVWVHKANFDDITVDCTRSGPYWGAFAVWLDYKTICGLGVNSSPTVFDIYSQTTIGAVDPGTLKIVTAVNSFVGDHTLSVARVGSTISIGMDNGLILSHQITKTINGPLTIIKPVNENITKIVVKGKINSDWLLQNQPAPTISITDSTIPSAMTEQYYSYQFHASVNSGVNWSTTSILPLGLSLNAGGMLYGTPKASGDYLITIKATDTTTNASITKSFNLYIGASATPTATPTVPTPTATPTVAPTPATTPAPTPAPTPTNNSAAGLNLRCTDRGTPITNIYLGDQFSLQVSITASSASSGGLKQGDYVDGYISLYSESKKWESFIAYDMFGNINFSAREVPIVSNWKLQPVTWVDIMTVSVPQDSSYVGTYTFKGYLVPNRGLINRTTPAHSYSVTVTTQSSSGTSGAN